MARVLFVCEGNVGRSPMAEALFARETAGGHASRSAGTRPSSSPSPLVIEAMREVGIDISTHRSRPLTHEDVEWADFVVVTGATHGLPAEVGEPIEWTLPRIKHEPLEVVRQVRDEIGERVKSLIDELKRLH